MSNQNTNIIFVIASGKPTVETALAAAVVASVVAFFLKIF
jgi:hypothetical protein